MPKKNEGLSSLWKKAAKLIMSMKKDNNQNVRRGLKLNIYTITLTAMFLMFLMGGGFESRNGQWSLKTEGLPGLLRAAWGRSTSDDVFEKYKDSTTIQDPDKLLRIIKEHIEKKDKKQ